ncbi:MAG: DNA polymerase IV [Alphaproteobacteria bacterium]|nr:DNA polymerase IV [Alphaproteobacteria bacterium]
MPAFCRDCLSETNAGAVRCPKCRSPRLLAHDELFALAIAHLDCDAFYASVEKRDNPALIDKPVIVGGGKRGVVSTCCYVARTYGVRSAMPMFKALAACPDAIVIRPDMRKYRDVALQLRERMRALTPLVQPLSLDEAFLDLSGTERLHGLPPAKVLAKLAREIERDCGITVSIGLSFNKFLAKVASELRKPRGFAVIGRAEAVSFLKEQKVTIVYGVGKSFARRLEADGITRLGQIQAMDARTLAKRYGEMGLHLARLSKGEDSRTVDPASEAKSLSTETTFETDERRHDVLERILWSLCESLSRRAKAAGLGGRTITLKLKGADFRSETRRRSLGAPTQLAEVIFAEGRELLRAKPEGPRYRLLGIGLSTLAPAAECDQPSLLDPGAARRASAERAIDRIRARFGEAVIGKGRGMKG